MRIVLSLIVAYTLTANAKTPEVSDAFEILAGESLPYTDVDAAVRLTFFSENQNARAEGRWLFDKQVWIADSAEYKILLSKIETRFNDLLASSTYLQTLRQQVLHRFDLLTPPNTRAQPRLMADPDAYREALNKTRSRISERAEPVEFNN